jgi:hypothetical protein
VELALVLHLQPRPQFRILVLLKNNWAVFQARLTLPAVNDQPQAAAVLADLGVLENLQEKFIPTHQRTLLAARLRLLNLGTVHHRQAQDSVYAQVVLVVLPPQIWKQTVMLVAVVAHRKRQ